ncbi:MAG: mannan endo,4-beta-mannosidase [Blastocatellia bacterium]|jgi:mannan endo-1,4-beta-mannosidase|nr:mannan endo,4-beta-mannosidase [Blastocatellia bacterium]
MGKKVIVVAALGITLSAAIVFLLGTGRGNGVPRGPAGFVQRDGARLTVDGKPYRFVGANIDLMFQKDTRSHMPAMMQFAAGKGITVVRVWASGEGGLEDVQPANTWKRDRWFRLKPNEWNEEEFIFLDRVIAEAARNGLRVQLCLANWWRDTGGVTQYMRWSGINGADDDKYPFGINNEKAMLFYTNATARRLYREHVEKIAGRRNSITGILYRDDPAIFGYELMNEAQAITGRWAERRAWIAEMSSYLKSIDPHHLVAPGDWGYRSAAERREWLLDHQLATIDYCDVHNYPRDDRDLSVDSPEALDHFVENRAAASYSLKKPLVLGEFGMLPEGHHGFGREVWFHSYCASALQNGAAGAMFWILTPSTQRGYGVNYAAPQDATVFSEVERAAQMFAARQNDNVPKRVLDAGQHLVPLQLAFNRSPQEAGLQPQKVSRDDGSLLYRFKPEMAVAGRFEKLGDGPGFVWGSGVGFFDYVVPPREDRRRVGHLVVRAHLQPVLPVDASPDWVKTRVTLFVNGTDCGHRLIPVENPKHPLIQEWMVDELAIRLRAARGLPLTIRFAVTVDSDWLYGINIANWPEGYESHDASPVEVEVR